MAITTRNLGPGADRYFGKLGLDEIINAGGGADVVVTGGRGKAGAGFVEVSSGNDSVPGISDPDSIYNESLPGFGLPFIGGHVIRNGVAQEYHKYDLGAKDASRISIADWDFTAKNPGKYKMLDVKVGGLFAIHGPGGDGTNATWIKSFDGRPGAQQISMAGDEADVFRFEASVTKSKGGGYDLNVSDIWLKTNTDSHSNNGQTVHIDDDFLSAAADFQTLHVDRNNYDARLDAVQGYVDRMSDGHGHDALLLGM